MNAQRTKREEWVHMPKYDERTCDHVGPANSGKFLLAIPYKLPKMMKNNEPYTALQAELDKTLHLAVIRVRREDIWWSQQWQVNPRSDWALFNHVIWWQRVQNDIQLRVKLAIWNRIIANFRKPIWASWGKQKTKFSLIYSTKAQIDTDLLKLVVIDLIEWIV